MTESVVNTVHNPVTPGTGGANPVTGIGGAAFVVTAPGGVDDTSLAQGVINTAEAAGGGKVVFSGGTYVLTRATVNYCLNVESSNIEIVLQPDTVLQLATTNALMRLMQSN